MVAPRNVVGDVFESCGLINFVDRISDTILYYVFNYRPVVVMAEKKL